MAIRVNDQEHPDSFSSKHFTFFESADEQRVWRLTGIVKLGDHLRGTGRDWKQEEFLIGVTVPMIPSGKALELKHWATHLALNAFSNDHSAQFAGWAVDSFVLDNARGQIFGPIVIGTRLAVRDVDGWIHRVSYDVDLVGSFADITGP